MDFETLLRFSKEFSLVWFFLVFIGVVAWAYWPSHQDEFNKVALRLLDDDPIHDKSAKQESDPKSE